MIVRSSLVIALPISDVSVRTFSFAAKLCSMLSCASERSGSRDGRVGSCSVVFLTLSSGSGSLNALTSGDREELFGACTARAGVRASRAVGSANAPSASAPDVGGLDERERAILDFERESWRLQVAKERAIRETFGISGHPLSPAVAPDRRPSRGVGV